MKKASRKLVLREEVKQERAVTVGEVLVEVGADLRELMVKGGLAIAAARAQTSAALSEAYAAMSYELALTQLQNLARSLGKKQPSAASSLREGMEESLTVKKLGV